MGWVFPTDFVINFISSLAWDGLGHTHVVTYFKSSQAWDEFVQHMLRYIL
jgi:hypothetical protein